MTIHVSLLVALLTYNSIVGLVMLICAVPLVERLGRRMMLLCFAPVCIASLLIIGGVLRTDGPAVGPVLITFA